MPFTEVAHDIWVARYPWFDVNVTLVRGSAGLIVVDTHASAAAAREVLADIRDLGVGSVTTVVNTHEHFDHVLGDGTFKAAFDDVAIYAHEEAAAQMSAAAERIKAAYAEAEVEDPHAAEVRDTDVVVAEHTFSSVVVLDLGDRLVELVHPGRGHTAGDLVVRVPDADVLLAGDLVEESAARQGVPGFGADCYPMLWPLSLDIVLGLLTNASVVVPGHGAPVDRDFVEEQRNAIGIVAETIRDLATRGIPVRDALAAADAWPYPREQLADAVRRGYEHLPRSQKRLPLI